MSNSKPVLAVVETVQNGSVDRYLHEIYKPEFWRPLIPLKTPLFISPEDKYFQFEINDNIILDPTGTLTQKLQAQGEIWVVDEGMQDEKGYLWTLKIKIPTLQADVEVRIRAKNVAPSNLKLGIYIQSLNYDRSLLQGFGQDAVLFAIRLYLRKAIQKAMGIYT